MIKIIYNSKKIMKLICKKKFHIIFNDNLKNL